MTPNTPMPMAPKNSARVPSPASRRRARFRDAQIDGRSRYGNASSQRRPSGLPSEDLIDLLQSAAARQAQEHFGEMLRRIPFERSDLGDRAVRDDPALQDDADQIAH